MITESILKQVYDAESEGFIPDRIYLSPDLMNDLKMSGAYRSESTTIEETFCGLKVFENAIMDENTCMILNAGGNKGFIMKFENGVCSAVEIDIPNFKTMWPLMETELPEYPNFITRKGN